MPIEAFIAETARYYRDGLKRQSRKLLQKPDGLTGGVAMVDRPETTTTSSPTYLAPEQRRNGLGAAALVIGVVSAVLVAVMIFFPFAFILGPLAIIFGMVGIARVNKREADNRSQAVAGIVLGAVSLIAAVILGIRIGTWVNDHQSDFRSFWSCITSAPTESQQQDCGRELADRLDQN